MFCDNDAIFAQIYDGFIIFHTLTIASINPLHLLKHSFVDFSINS